MTELEMCDTLGILFDPDKNRLTVTDDIRNSIDQVSQAFHEMNTQKALYGVLNEDIWLEFIPWHSLN
jgi:hypothetical protein